MGAEGGARGAEGGGGMSFTAFGGPRCVSSVGDGAGKASTGENEVKSGLKMIVGGGEVGANGWCARE